MGHNTYKINNKGSDPKGENSVNNGVIYIGRGETQTYAGTLATDQKLEFYDSNPINTITGASFTKRSGTNWIQEVTLPAGTYSFRAGCLIPTTHASSVSGLSVVNLMSGATTLRLGICNATPSYFDDNIQYNKNEFSVLTFTNSTTITFIIAQIVIAGIASSIWTDDRISETAYLFIRKLA